MYRSGITGLTFVAALALPAAAWAQAGLIGQEAIDDRIEDIQTDVAEDIDEGRDPDRFGPRGYADGWTGAVSLGLSATSGNTDTADLSLGARLTYGQGPNLFLFGLGAEISEDNDIRSQEEVFATLEYNRYFTDRFYAFALGTVSYDDFSSNEIDAFLGGGPGYVVLSTPDTRWRVQAGVGARYVEDQTGADETEFAGIASSRLFWEFTETVYLTNDTDFLYSDESFVVSNDLGLNFRLNNTLTARWSVNSEYDDSPLPGLDSTDHTLRLSLIAGY